MGQDGRQQCRQQRRLRNCYTIITAGRPRFRCSQHSKSLGETPILFNRIIANTSPVSSTVSGQYPALELRDTLGSTVLYLIYVTWYVVTRHQFYARGYRYSNVSYLVLISQTMVKPFARVPHLIHTKDIGR